MKVSNLPLVRISSWFVVILCSVLFSYMAQAQKNTLSPEEVQERIDVFDEIEIQFKALRFKIVNQKSQDATTALEYSRPLVELAYQLEDLFRLPSARNSYPFSRAKPEIWSQKERFDLLLGRFISNLEEIDDLLEAKQIEPAAQLLDTVAKSCRQCHNGYRYR